MGTPLVQLSQPNGVRPAGGACGERRHIKKISPGLRGPGRWVIFFVGAGPREENKSGKK
jgi:hypothetical protein